jgi:hypothetical protein
MTAKSLATIIGVIFIAVGILGFIDNPIVGTSEKAIFHADKLHNIVHIASGVLFLLFSMGSASAARSFMILFGIIYLALGVIGLVNFGTSGMGKIFGILHVNGADNLLHVGLGVVILLAGAVSRRAV